MPDQDWSAWSTSRLTRRDLLLRGAAASLGWCGASLLTFPSGAFAKENNKMATNDAQSRWTTGLVFDERYLRHSLGGGHPESPARLEAIMRRLRSTGFDQRLLPIAPTVDPSPYLRAVHSDAHLRLVARQAPDEAICRLAVSGVLSAVDAVCTGSVTNAFCAVRPPGHHAGDEGESGFCFYNNVAIAARYAQRTHRLARVLIVDWDYHHGDGTEWAFYSDPTVLFFSTHALYAFPGTGAASRTGSGAGKGFTINVPLPPGADDRTIQAAFTDRLVPAARAFRPDLVLISAGFDSRVGDRLGDFAVTDAGFAALTRLVMTLAAESGQSRIVSVLEGGYDPEGLALAVESHLRALLGE